jgi:hypothetical protein
MRSKLRAMKLARGTYEYQFDGSKPVEVSIRTDQDAITALARYQNDSREARTKKKTYHFKLIVR